MTDTATLARDAASDFAVAGTGVRFAAEPRLGIAKLQILADDPDAWFESTLGIAPPPVLREIERDGLAVAWLAPGEWLVTGPEEAVEQVRRHCAEAAGALGLMVDISHARASFVLAGPAVWPVLAAHCPLDIRDVAMPVGTAVRSMFSDTGFFLSRRLDRDGEPCFRLIFDQTMSGYAERMLGATILGECS